MSIKSIIEINQLKLKKMILRKYLNLRIQKRIWKRKHLKQRIVKRWMKNQRLEAITVKLLPINFGKIKKEEEKGLFKRAVLFVYRND